MPFEITILGNNSAAPAFNRHPTAQYIQIGESCFLMDCGEGTQMQMSRYKVKRSRIKQIFISHLHGDHYFGLIGLLTSMHLNKRAEPMEIFSPAGLQQIIEMQLKVSDTRLYYPLIFHVINTEASSKIFENKELEILNIPLNHRIPTCGYLFREKKGLRKINVAAAKQENIPVSFYNDLKAGKDFVNEKGRIIKNKKVTFDPNPIRSYAFCSDTIYDERIIPIVKNADILYHESTFLEDSAHRAAETFHSTAKQAAQIAKQASVKRLLLGHFSAKYDKLQAFAEEASLVFPESYIAEEGKTFEIMINV